MKKLIYTILIFISCQTFVSAQFSPLQEGESVVTCFSGLDPSSIVVAIMDIRSPATNGAVKGQNWIPQKRVHDDWTKDVMGEVFGIAIDNSGNIFVTRTFVYRNDNEGTPSEFVDKFGVPDNGGEVYRLDAITGNVTLFAQLPNEREGLGNIAYDEKSNQLFVSNFHDGCIYRIENGGIRETRVIDKFAPYSTSPNQILLPNEFTGIDTDNDGGLSVNGKRIYGLGIEQLNGETNLYYGQYRKSDGSGNNNGTNGIGVLSLNTDGSFNIATGQNDLLSLSTSNNPVADITFTADGRMFLSERTLNSIQSSGAHRSVVYSFEKQNGIWNSDAPFFPIGAYEDGVNAAGGIAYDQSTNLLWSTGDALRIATFTTSVAYCGEPDGTNKDIYGMTGIPSEGVLGNIIVENCSDGTFVNNIIKSSYFVDFDGNTMGQDKFQNGDVEIFSSCNVVARFDFDFDANSTLCDASFFNTSFIDDLEVDNFSWDFGDGFILDNISNPKHIFSEPGTYEVTLTVTTISDQPGETGCSSSVTNTVTLEDCENCYDTGNPDPDIGLPLKHGMAVVTCRNGTSTGSSNYVLGIIDTRNPVEREAPTDGLTDWGTAIEMYHHPNWTRDELGHVFGLALDDEVNPNIYVTNSSSYRTSQVGPDNTLNRIYKIDGITGEPSVFYTFNQSNDNVGLGNLCYDKDHQQFFVTNFDDGKIYRISKAGVLLSTFDPFESDVSGTNIAPLGERIWGVAYYESKVYFARWSDNLGPDGNCSGSFSSNSDTNNGIYSIAVNPTSGDFIGAEKEEVSIAISPNLDINPGSDIAFSSFGNMIVSQRSMCSDFIPAAHRSQVLEYKCVADSWVPSENLFPVGNHESHRNASGGVAYTGDGRVWATGDFLTRSSAIYGMVGFPINGLTTIPSSGITVSGVTYIDFDGTYGLGDKYEQGDVEVFSQTSQCLPKGALEITLGNAVNEPTVFEILNLGGYQVAWDFGDGTNSTDANPTHQYTTDGDFYIIANVTGPCDCGYTLKTKVTIGGKDLCENCITSFSPLRGEKYVFSTWIREQTPAATYNSTRVEISFTNGSLINVGTFTYRPSGEVIDGWQRVYGEFVVPQAAFNINVSVINESEDQDIFMDDIRIHPFNSSMKSYVYDPVHYRLMAELDGNNYATYYEYDEEGGLVRVKKETERGVFTIQESRNNSYKKAP